MQKSLTNSVLVAGLALLAACCLPVHVHYGFQVEFIPVDENGELITTQCTTRVEKEGTGTLVSEHDTQGEALFLVEERLEPGWYDFVVSCTGHGSFRSTRIWLPPEELGVDLERLRIVDTKRREDGIRPAPMSTESSRRMVSGGV